MQGPRADEHGGKDSGGDGIGPADDDQELTTSSTAASCGGRTDLRVVSLNTGAGYHQRIGSESETCVEPSFDARRLMALLMGIESERVNLFALQEADRYRERSCTHPDLEDERCGDHTADFSESLELFGSCHPFDTYYAPQLEAPSSCPDGNDGQYGNALIADADLRSTANWRLTTVCTDTGAGAIPECRGAAVAKMDFAGHDVWAVNVHLDCRAYENQLNNLMDRIDELPADDAVILAGDFNIFALGDGAQGRSSPCVAQAGELPRWNTLFAKTAASGLRLVSGFEHTAPAHDPSMTIDYVFLRDPQGLFTASAAHRISPAWYGWSSNYYTTDHVGVEVILETGLPRSPSLNWAELLETGIVPAVF